jgi:hypothetical protein
MIKLNGSAVLIALFAGTILTALLALSALSNQGILNKIGLENDRAVARIAAQSGVEDGLLRYKRAIENNQASTIYDVPEDKIDQGNASYKLAVKVSPLSVGEDFGKSDWITDPDRAFAQGSLALGEGQQLDVDLNYFFKYQKQKEHPLRIEVKFSDLFTKDKDKLKKLAQSESKISYELINLADGNNISSDEFLSGDSHSFSINNLSSCENENTACLLRIKSSGGGITFLKMQSRSAAGKIKPTGEKPGTIIIESTGFYKRSRVILQAKYDSLQGKYLGMYNAVVE